MFTKVTGEDLFDLHYPLLALALSNQCHCVTVLSYLRGCVYKVKVRHFGLALSTGDIIS